MGGCKALQCLQSSRKHNVRERDVWHVDVAHTTAAPAQQRSLEPSCHLTVHAWLPYCTPQAGCIVFLHQCTSSPSGRWSMHCNRIRVCRRSSTINLPIAFARVMPPQHHMPVASHCPSSRAPEADSLSFESQLLSRGNQQLGVGRAPADGRAGRLCCTVIDPVSPQQYNKE